ncbi:hypothetical protein [Planctomicrobium sp. SH664]|uniref:hypothetical protein n=1 Tax=Planctomicrobium sp. SH664 TaxID=3448125 RepID=UPI003F5AEBA0
MVWFNFLARFSVASCALILISGCQEGPQFPESTVTGIILYNKEPLESGTITFLAENQGTPSAQAMITDGMYTVKVPHGNKRVEINSSKWTGKPYEEFGIKETIQFLPAKYNERSELRAEIGPKPELELNFELEGLSK